MINQELLEYVNKKVSEGATKESLIGELTNGGWTEADINEAFKIPRVTSPKSSDGLFNFIIGIFIIIIIFSLAQFTVGILTEENPMWAKVLVSILSFIIIPIIAFSFRKKVIKNKKEDFKKPQQVIEAYKPKGVANRLAYSIFIFIGLWLLFSFLDFAFFYRDRESTSEESFLQMIMFIPVIIIPIYAFFKKK